MEKDIVYKPLYSVGKIVENKIGGVINCAFCKKEIKISQSKIVINEVDNDDFYHL